MGHGSLDGILESGNSWFKYLEGHRVFSHKMSEYLIQILKSQGSKIHYGNTHQYEKNVGIYTLRKEGV